jgi:hypothetical protein
MHLKGTILWSMGVRSSGQYGTNLMAIRADKFSESDILEPLEVLR